MVVWRPCGLFGLGTFLFAATVGAEPSSMPPPGVVPAAAPTDAPAAPADAPAAPADPPAPAAAAAPTPSVATVPVTFRTTIEDGELRIQGPGIEPGGGACGSSCTLNVTPGGYTVMVGSGGSIQSFNVYVRERSEVVVSPPNGFHRGLGLALLVGGGVVFSAGALVLYADLKSRADDERYGDVDSRYRYRSPDWVLPVVIAGGIGAGVTAVGIVLFLTARTSADVLPQRAQAERRRRAASRGSSLSLVPELGPTGGSLRVDWSF
jgi:hypothetical protein